VPVVTFRGKPFLPSDLVTQVAEATELGSMFLHSLYTSYLIRLQAQRTQEPMTRQSATHLIAQHLHADDEISNVTLALFLAPIDEMILDNTRRG
jgi:hypothetical protein